MPVRRASCCSGPVHCLGPKRRRSNHRSAWLELWNAPSPYQTHQEPPDLCQKACATSLWELNHLCQDLDLPHSPQTGVSHLRRSLEGTSLYLPRAFQSIPLNMCSIRPVEGSTRQIYRVTRHRNRPCNGSAAPTQSLSKQYLLTRFIDV